MTTEQTIEIGNAGRYTKKPVTIEAWRNPVRDGNSQDHPGTPDWLRDALRMPMYEVGSVRPCASVVGAFVINTLEGDMRADPGDWIIRGVKGELYPCKPDIFEATYRPYDANLDLEEDTRNLFWSLMCRFARHADECPANKRMQSMELQPCNCGYDRVINSIGMEYEACRAELEQVKQQLEQGLEPVTEPSQYVKDLASDTARREDGDAV